MTRASVHKQMKNMMYRSRSSTETISDFAELLLKVGMMNIFIK